MIGNYDDFVCLVPIGISEIATSIAADVFAVFGIVLMGAKRFIWPVNNFLGLDGVPRNWTDLSSLTIPLSPDMSIKWKMILDQIARERRVPHPSIGSIIGKMVSPKTIFIPHLIAEFPRPSTKNFTRPRFTITYTGGGGGWWGGVDSFK